MKMRLHRISLQCAMEARWTGAGKIQLAAENNTLWSGENDNEHRQGITVVDQKQVSNTLLEWKQLMEDCLC